MGLERERGEDEAQAKDKYAEASLRLEEQLTAELEELCRREQVTLNSILQGAWGVLLSRYSREDDVVFGATVSGRSGEVAGIDKMVGLFINTLWPHALGVL